MNRATLRAIATLQYLARRTTAATLGEIAAGVGIPTSTQLEILRALVKGRFVEVQPGPRYRLGIGAFEVGSAYLRGLSWSEVARSEVVRLVNQLGVTGHFAVLDGADVLYLQKENPASGLEIQLVSAVGVRLPAVFTAVGQAQLAQLADEAVIARVGSGPYRSRNGLAQWTRDELLERLHQVRIQGYAVDEEFTAENVLCVAAPVFMGSGECCGAIGVSFVRTQRGLQIEDAAPHVVAAAGSASERLGYRIRGFHESL